MNARISALTCILMFTAPAVISELGLPSVPFAPPEAHAQDKVTELAREKFKEGVKAYDSGQYEQARTLFLQAYALKRHPAVLLNLGQSELKAGYVEDGGNHLQEFLREHKAATDDQARAAQAGIQEAQRKTGFIIVIVDTDGADVSVDGKNIGQSPLLDPYFVKPGTHQVAASKGGKTDRSDVDAKRGTATPVTLDLGGGAAAPPVVTPVPTPSPTPSPVGPPAPSPEPPPASYPPPGPLGPAPTPMPLGMPPDEGPDTGGRQAFFPWFVDTPLAWVGAGLVGVGIIGTVAFGIAAAGAQSSADDVAEAIRQQQAQNTDPGDAGFVPDNRQPCGPEDNPSADLPFYANACEQLRDNIDAYDTDIVALAVFATVGGLAAAGTVIYYFVDSSDGGDTASLQITPLIGPDTQGVGVVGSF